MEGNTVISFANVSAHYDNNKDVLSNVSFNISSGSFYFLTGPSGAGKTTLLRLIYQLHKPANGKIRLFGQDCDVLSRDDISLLRHKMAIVFQEYSLISHMTVFDNIALPLRVRGFNDEKIKKLELSGGQQQRVSVARAIIIQPSILLADEPTGNLDDENASRLMELFIQMNKVFGTTIILATHNKKLLETHKFPVISILDHHVTFSSAGKIDTARKWKGPKPQSNDMFKDLSKQFENIGNV